MTTTLPRTAGGGVHARRAVLRWGWRLFRREWRQQLLILGLLAVAVAATIWGAGVANNTLPSNPNYGTFGTAAALVTLPGSDPHLAADIAAIQYRWGPADVIRNQNITTGTTQSVQLRAESPHGLYSGPMLGLVSGAYPSGPGQVALTGQVATLYNAHVGGTWQAAGRTWRVTGIVQNPSNLRDEFALVAPGQVTHPSQVIMLLGSAAASQIINANGAPNQSALAGVPAATPSIPTGSVSTIPSATIVLVAAVLGLIFIGLVAVAGFSVMAQRRLRALGMLSAIGATERNVRLVMIVNGMVVGVAAALAGAVLGFAAWFAYVPALQQDTGHVVHATNLPWWAIATGIVLAIATSVLASLRPATTMARVPVVAALSGRPATPKAIHRSAAPGVIAFAAGVAFLYFAGGPTGQRQHAGLLLLAGLVAVIVGIFLLAPLAISVLAAGAGPRLPVAIRIALRDLVRYRARSGAALAATTFAVFLAMLICVVASIKAADPLDWMGPNLSSSQLIVYVQPQIGGGFVKQLTSAQLVSLGRQVDRDAAGWHAQPVLPLEVTDASLFQVGRKQHSNVAGTPVNDVAHFTGNVYVATPQLLAMYGIKASQISPGADILTVRPGLAGLPRMQMTWGNPGGQPGPGGGPGGGGNSSCTPSTDCLPDPVIQTTGGLPDGTSAPNTVITEYAVSRYHLTLSLDGWLIQAPGPLSAAQINTARQLALAFGVTVETKSGSLSLGEITDGVTALGLVIAFGVLAMSVGLIRSETARDLRTLTATGASARTRRMITAATAAALGLLGAVLGIAGAVMAGLAWTHS
ncbi:MAG TPA: FtsX-like permease family protein, partial [Streptosporangiaceae bacterium]|nr:FtsX-like permease family protein [Streptosporangiaceae bacterium]